MKRLLTVMILGGWFSSPAYADDLAGVPNSQRPFVEGEAAKMRAAGLDAKPLYNKIREGVAKGAPSEALQKAVTREREHYTEAARLLAPVSSGGNPTKNTMAQSVVIAVKRGAKTADIESAVKQHKQNPLALMGVIDLLGDFARFGISGEKAVRAAAESAGRKAVSSTTPPDSRADTNRSIMQREIQQNLPTYKPVETRPTTEPHNPNGTQGGVIHKQP